jgi:hypothetical protein
MILYRYLLIVTLLVFISCQTKPDKSTEQTSNKKSVQFELDTLSKTVQIPIITASPQADSSWGSYIAVLKDGLDQVNATINDSIIFVATKGQLFLYESNSHSAWITDGRCAYIPLEQVKRADLPYFKFTFSRWNFNKDEKYELYATAKQNGLNLNTLIKKIQNKDSRAMLQFFDLRNKVDGAAAAEFPFELWALLNLWNDKELSAFIQSLPEKDKTEFCQLLINITPFEKPEEYFKLYYPLTFEEIIKTE